MQVAALVLAAGKGTRFTEETGDPMPKVLRPVLGRPMVNYVINALREAGVNDITLVVGYRADDVVSALGNAVEYVRQTEQKGSGHAVASAREVYDDYNGTLVIMCGDSPLFSSCTIRDMIQRHTDTSAAITMVATELDEPAGYGRVMRDSDGRVVGVVEEKCASEIEKAVKEVNGGAYAFDAAWLFANIDKMRLNQAGEYNLTDMVRVAVGQGMRVETIPCDAVELLGVNNPAQLKSIEDILRGSRK